MNSSDFLSLLDQKQTLVLDGATGTNLQKRGLPIGTAPETWLFDNPAGISQLYSDFVQAGSDIILTCTFGGNRTRLAHANLTDKIVEVNQTAVVLAKEVIQDKDVLIAGSLGPTGEMMQPFGSMSEAQVLDIYAEQAKILLDSNVDLLVIETQFDLNEAQAAVRAVRSMDTEIALVCSFSFDRGVRTMMGVKPVQVAEIFNDLPVDAIGINCGKSLEDNLAVLKTLKENTTKPIWFKPNAGLPTSNVDGSTSYDVTPEKMGNQAKLWIAEGARLVGGCCGTSPEHLAAIAKSARAN
ncbi:MAG: homocysteine S-methyltransferase family protein [Anaerolineaceae bacterium]|nr:homocysteine S-methyltransferase family protein [Anaerolineaceae bacterium]